MSTTRETVIAAIRAVAPELDADDLTDDARLQEDLDLDSMDFLDVVTGLSERTGVDIPERDYPELATIGDCVAYLERHTATA
jgi:acyl carrier protein